MVKLWHRIILTADLFIFQKIVNINKFASLKVFVLTFCFGCSSSEDPRFLFPSEKEMQVRYLCQLPYHEASSVHKPWTKSTPDFLIVGKKKVIVFFNNDRSFVLGKDLKVNLPSGQYKCHL